MKIVSSRGVLAAAVLLSAAPAAATNGMRMIGFGPVQDSMGGASVGAPLDAATIVTNPAGMSSLERRVDLAGTWFNPTVKYKATDGYGMTSGNEQESDRAASLIPTFGVIVPVGDKLSLGLGVVGVSGMGVDYGADLFGSKTLTSFMNLRVAPAASYKINDQVSVGVAANLQYATMKWDVLGAMGNPPRKEDGALGIGVTLGVTYKPVTDLTLGLAWESQSSFQDYEFDLGPAGTEKLDFNQPQVVTLGASYKMDALLLAADVEWINWSATNGKDMPKFTQATPATNPWNMNWDDQFVVKIGAQFEATKELKIRAGYNYGKMPLDEQRSFENIAFPAVAEHHVSLGAGYDIGALTVNVAGIWSPEAKISYTDTSPTAMITSYETKMSQLQLDLGLAYKF
ncbi:MAG: outer membrane protein transport protein [Anaeromyxobacteraceae bacterium]